MFGRLRTRLTLLYAGLFALVIAAVVAVLSISATETALKSAYDQLRATSTAHGRIEQLKLSQLSDSAAVAARDYGFRSAVASADPATIASALQNLKLRVGADIVWIVTPDGTYVSEAGVQPGMISAALLEAMQTSGAVKGAILVDGRPFRVAATSVAAPHVLGWLLIGSALNDAEMTALVSLASIPLHADLYVQAHGSDWVRAAGDLSGNEKGVNALASKMRVSSSISSPTSADGAFSADLTAPSPIATLDGSGMKLLLSYPRHAALASLDAQRALLITVMAFGIVFLAIGAWGIAHGITRPMGQLEAATRRIEEGDYVRVAVEGRDEIGRLASSFNLMVDAIKEREQAITHNALHDRETGLHNREHMERQLRATATSALPTFVAVLGIDRFNPIRDAIGYQMAVTLVARLGARLAEVNPLCGPARISEDRLAIAFPASDEAAATSWLESVLPTMARPIEVSAQLVDIALSCGLSVYQHLDAAPGPAIDLSSIALDQARRRNVKIALFDPVAYGDPMSSISLMGEMLTGLATGCFFLAHQPKLNLRTGQIDSVEALVRWRHPVRGLIRPDAFIPLAEETGKIRELTEWVMAQAVRDQRELMKQGHDLVVGVNISGRLLGDPILVEMTERFIRSNPERFCFEITETAAMQDPERALQQLQILNERGITISIDDYGSGLSSLSYLKRLPARELKIDRSILEGLGASSREAVLLRSTIDLGHGLGMKVTAEGIEDSVTLAALQAMGCDCAQGYHISRPMPLDDLLQFLRAWSPEATASSPASNLIAPMAKRAGLPS